MDGRGLGAGALLGAVPRKASYVWPEVTDMPGVSYLYEVDAAGDRGGAWVMGLRVVGAFLATHGLEGMLPDRRGWGVGRARPEA